MKAMEFKRKDYMYIRAVKADINVNTFLQKSDPAIADLKRVVPGQILHRFSVFHNHPRILDALLVVFDVCFWWLLYLVNVAFLLQFIVERIRFGRFEIPKNPDNVLIGDTLGRYFYQMLENACIPNYGSNWIIFRKRSFPSIDKKFGSSVYYIRLLRLKDLWVSFVLANRQIYLVRRCCGIEHTLHAGKAFHWYAFRQAFARNLPCREIVFINENDRWYFLFQSLKSRRVMIQHGVLSKDAVILDKWLTPYKQTSVDLLYCHNEEEEWAFRKFVRDIREVKYFTPKICLSKLPSSTPSILIICNVRFYSAIEEQIVREIHERHPDVIMYVKPHPAQPVSFYRKLARAVPFKLILNPFFYPEVDIVVAYHSSLASQYESCGADVVYMTDAPMEDVLTSVFNRLSQLDA